MERPDQIFAAWVIHTGLAADGCIDHRQERGWNLDNTNAPKPGCRCKTGHVSHHPTAQGEHQGAAFKPVFKGGVMNQRHRRRSFVLLAGFDQHQLCLEAMPFQGFDADVSVSVRHVRVTDHQNLTPLPNTSLKQCFTDVPETALSDHHLIGISIKGDSDPAMRQGRSSGHRSEAASIPLCRANHPQGP